MQNRLPELLCRLLDVVNLPITIQPTVNPETTNIPAIYQEVIDFLIIATADNAKSSVIEVSASKEDLGGESIGLFLLTRKAILF